ncbi:unnamed protein product [Pleuronectes platessa]|uniref:Uncharacterized protein n=1 Tax=Pleuronectes platessa TaxID=8262 RepID=A0A9N7UCE3_PLEPL|nr:unnamed protein product [Pleuronectes platessa]
MTVTYRDPRIISLAQEFSSILKEQQPLTSKHLCPPKVVLQLRTRYPNFCPHCSVKSASPAPPEKVKQEPHQESAVIPPPAAPPVTPPAEPAVVLEGRGGLAIWHTGHHPAQQQQVRRETSEEDSTMMSEWRQQGWTGTKIQPWHCLSRPAHYIISVHSLPSLYQSLSVESPLVCPPLLEGEGLSQVPTIPPDTVTPPVLTSTEQKNVDLKAKTQKFRKSKKARLIHRRVTDEVFYFICKWPGDSESGGGQRFLGGRKLKDMSSDILLQRRVHVNHRGRLG